MKVLITGACGFIGRNLIRELEQLHQLRLLDQNRPKEATVGDVLQAPIHKQSTA